MLHGSRSVTTNQEKSSEFKAMYQFMEDVEPFERYCLGGYYPTHIGDILAARYRIVHKLGFGASSTIWLARDEQTSRYVALKVGVAGSHASSESAVLRLLEHGKAEQGKPLGSVAIQPLLDEFKIEGPEIEGQKATHACLVTAPARISLAEAREASFKRIFQPAVARAIAAQLIQAVAFLHSRGVVHSDLHEGNVLLRLPKALDTLTPEQLYTTYGQPDLEPAIRRDGKPLDAWVPTHGVIPVWLGDACENITLPESEILLIDFSESFQPATTERFASPTPLILWSPELFLEPTWPESFAAEIWALGCTIFGILGQRALFDTWFPSRETMIEEYMNALGPLPRDWRVRMAEGNDALQQIENAPRRTLEMRIEYSIQEPRKELGFAEMEREEFAALLSLLSSMLNYKVGDRPSAQNVLDSEWMVRWAKPCLDQARALSRSR